MANGTEKRASKTERRFYNAEGKEDARAQADTVRASVTFVDTGDVLEMDFTKLEPGVVTAAAAFGIMTSVTNAAGGSNSSLTPFERASDRWETLLGGEWQGEREGGPQIGLIVEAAANLGFDAETVRAKLKSEELSAATLLKNAALEAEVLKIKEQRLAKKRAERAQEAGSAKAALADLIG